MLLLTLNFKNMWIGFTKGHEFGSEERPKFYALRLLFITIMYLSPKSDITRVLNRANSSRNDYSWVKGYNETISLEVEQRMAVRHQELLRKHKSLEDDLINLNKKYVDLNKKHEAVGITARAIKRFYQENLEDFK